MTDYKNAHLAWLNETKNFMPKYPADYELPYIKVMAYLYHSKDFPQSMAKIMYDADQAWYYQSKEIAKEVRKEILKTTLVSSDYYFVSIGFNHMTWNAKDCIKAIQKILAQNWIIQGKAQFEYYREGGTHPHCHFFIETKDKKNEIIRQIFKGGYMKKLIIGKNSIDVKEGTDYRNEYINLFKKEDKIELIKKDIIWRQENNVPIFEKNWTLGKNQEFDNE